MKENLKRKIMWSLRENPKTMWELINDLNCNAKEFSHSINELLSESKIKDSEGTIELVEKSEKLKFRPSRKKHLYFNPNDEIYKKFEKVSEDYNPEKQEFHQERISTVDIFNKTALMALNNDLQGADIAVLGDDDLFSIAAAFTGMPKSITVLEIDSDVRKKIDEIAGKEGFEISTHHADFSEPLDKKFHKKFDVFVTEPPEAILGFFAFLSRGFEAVRDFGVGYYSETPIENSVEHTMEEEKKILEAGFIITNIHRQFETYFEKAQDDEETYTKAKLVQNTKVKFVMPNVDFWKVDLVRIESIGKHKPIITRKLSQNEIVKADEIWSYETLEF